MPSPARQVVNFNVDNKARAYPVVTRNTEIELTKCIGQLRTDLMQHVTAEGFRRSNGATFILYHDKNWGNVRDDEIVWDEEFAVCTGPDERLNMIRQEFNQRHPGY